MVRTLDFEAKQLTVNTFSWTTFYPAELHNKNKAHSTHDFLFFLFCFFLLPYAQKPSYEAMPNYVGLRMRNSHFCMLNLMLINVSYVDVISIGFLKPFFFLKPFW